MRHVLTSLILFCGASTSLVAAAPAARNDALINRMIVNEHHTITELGEHRPLVESYLQLTHRGAGQPEGDEYSLARVDMNHVLESSVYRKKDEHSSLLDILSTARFAVKPMSLRFNKTAMLDMLSPDARQFDLAHYKFDYVRSGFLGTRKVSIYDVSPLTRRHSTGLFLGRIWVDQNDATLIRFTGVFAGGSGKRPRFLHFDSWRGQIKPGLWMPTATYIEDTTAGSAVHGQLRMWGYDRDGLVRREDSNTSMQVVDATDDSPTDLSPLGSLQAWRKQAEDNLVEELEAAGLLAPSGKFEKVLNQIVVNLAVPSNISLGNPIHCRVLLTTPIEATTIGDTILVSKGLIDTVPSVETLASVIAWQLAHIELEHSLDTRYAFSDRLMFPAKDTYRHLYFAHTDAQNSSAVRFAKSLLTKSMYADKLANVSAYYAILQNRAVLLPQLSHGMLGDSLLAPDGSAWMQSDLPSVSVKQALTEFAAVPKPLGSSLVIDPWRDGVRWLESAPETLTALDNHPFEVLPYFAYPQQ
jgi:hypothetical protein